MSLNTRFFLLYGVGTAFLVSLVTLVVFNHVESIMLDHLKHRFEEKVRGELRLLQNNVLQTTKRFEFVTEMPLFRAMRFHQLTLNEAAWKDDVRQLELYFLEMQRNQPSLKVIHFMDPKGMELFRIEKLRVVRDASNTSQRPDMQALMQLEKKSVRVTASGQTSYGDYELIWWVPLFTSANTRLGLLGFHMTHEWMHETVLAMAKSGIDQVCLTDADNNILMSNQDEHACAQDKPSHWHIQGDVGLPGLSWKVKLSTDTDGYTQEADDLQTWLFTLVIPVFILVAFLISFFTSRGIVNAIQRLVQATRMIGQGGDTLTTIDLNRKDELGELGHEINRAATLVQEKSLELENRIWLAVNVAKFGSLIHRARTLPDFAQSLIRRLTPFLHGACGVLYVLDDDTEKYHLMGSYGYTAQEHLSHTFALGEGMVGQCAVEKEPILLKNVPDNHLKVITGLGESKPLTILNVPLLFQDQVLAVVEVASFREFTTIQLSLIDELAPLLGLGLENQNRSQRTERLLSQTQQQSLDLAALAEELRTQQEALQESNNELQAKTDALQSSEEEMRLQREELQSTNQELADRTYLLEQQKSALEVAHQEIGAKARALATASQYKSEFLANMSHELRSPLNSLLLLSEDLARNDQKNLNEDQTASLQIIHSSGRDLLHLINDILDLAKIEAGRVDLLDEELDLNDFAHHMKRQFSPVALQKRLSWQVEIDPKAPEVIQTDGGKVGQIVKNLVSNALKFTETGGVTLRIQPMSRPWAVAIAVQDSGIGIAEEKHALIFEAFQQADGSTTRQYGGTGLGLSISQELAKRLGGEIQVQSQVDKGSLFTLHLPAKMEKPPIPPVSLVKTKIILPRHVADMQPAKDIADDRKIITSMDRVVLIIEDDPVFAEFLYRLSHEKGFKCLITPAGEMGLELAIKHHPVAIILDIALSGPMDGLTVMDRLKKNPMTGNTPVHIISSADNQHIEGLAKGAMGYLNKPVNRAQLDEVFQSIEACASLEGKKLLVVDGDPQSHAAIVTLIQSQTSDVTLATRGEEAYTLLQQSLFHCIILNPDTLPDLNGFDLLERVDAEETLANPVVIIYTDRKLSAHETSILKKYADSIVVKGVGRAKKRWMEEISSFLQQMEIQAKKTPDPERDAVFKDKTILLVDDDMRNVYALSKILRSHGLTVLAADDGEKSLQLLDKRPDIDLVLMDVIMPVMDGYQAMREIRKQARFETLPIIALTVKAMQLDREECLAAGASEYMAKPVDVDKLLALMRVWLHGQT